MEVAAINNNSTEKPLFEKKQTAAGGDMFSEILSVLFLNFSAINSNSKKSEGNKGGDMSNQTVSMSGPEIQSYSIQPQNIINQLILWYPEQPGNLIKMETDQVSMGDNLSSKLNNIVSKIETYVEEINNQDVKINVQGIEDFVYTIGTELIEALRGANQLTESQTLGVNKSMVNFRDLAESLQNVLKEIITYNSKTLDDEKPADLFNLLVNIKEEVKKDLLLFKVEHYGTKSSLNEEYSKKLPLVKAMQIKSLGDGLNTPVVETENSLKQIISTVENKLNAKPVLKGTLYSDRTTGGTEDKTKLIKIQSDLESEEIKTDENSCNTETKIFNNPLKQDDSKKLDAITNQLEENNGIDNWKTRNGIHAKQRVEISSSTSRDEPVKRNNSTKNEIVRNVVPNKQSIENTFSVNEGESGIQDSQKQDNKSELSIDNSPKQVTGISTNLKSQGEAITENPETATISNKEDLANLVTEKFKALKLPERTELHVKLKPKELGEIAIKVVLEKGQINGSIFADKKDVVSMIQSQMDLIRDNLKNNNIHLNNVTVNLSSSDTYSNNSSRHQGYEGKKEKKHLHKFAQTEKVADSDGFNIIA